MNRIATAGPETSIQYPATPAPSPAATGNADRIGRVVLIAICGVTLLVVAWAGYAGAASEARAVVSHSTAQARPEQQNGSQEYMNWLARAHEQASLEADASDLPSQF